MANFLLMKLCPTERYSFYRPAPSSITYFPFVTVTPDRNASAHIESSKCAPECMNANSICALYAHILIELTIYDPNQTRSPSGFHYARPGACLSKCVAGRHFPIGAGVLVDPFIANINHLIKVIYCATESLDTRSKPAFQRFMVRACGNPKLDCSQPFVVYDSDQ